ncbi:MAG: helix-hairpin-helix domain-containing protein [Candidatus Thorarchaeota archaeon]
MTSVMNISNSIGKDTAQKLKEIGIDSIEKLASSKIEDLLIIDGMGISNARIYIQFARKHIERINARQKVYNIIKNRNMPNKSSSVDILNNKEKELEKKTNSRVNISSIKKLASTSIEDLSKTQGIDTAKAQRYIQIAKKYLETMRQKEEEARNAARSKINRQDQVLGFIKFNNKSSLQKMESVQPIKQKENIILEKPSLDHKSIKKPTISIKSIKKPTIEIKPTEKTSHPKDTRTKRPKVDIKKQPEMKTFFSPSTMQQIRFYHFKIKKLEEVLERNEDFSFSELNNIIEYIKILNVNYKTQSQIKIFKELDITPSFYDPLAKKEIKIWDLIFECSRALWISAKAYSYLANKFETENLMERAIIAMVECSKMFKTAAYFSAACTRQEDKGIALSVDNLELNSEEARILAQNLATISEEKKGNFSMASNLSAGLSALTKRLAFLRKYNTYKEYQFKAQYNYDMGKACNFKAKYLIKISPEGENEDKIEELQKKANYYYLKAEEIWESMLNRFDTLSDVQREGLQNNLSIVNNNIIENDVEKISDAKALEIQDPEPLIIIPENLAPFVPRTTNFLTKYKQSDLNFDAYLRYKNLMSEVTINSNKIEELKNSKAGIGRTLKQLKILYENNDIDINSFTELFEKYSIKLEAIESAIKNLRTPDKRKVSEEQKQSLKPIM